MSDKPLSLVEEVLANTPARLLVGRTGPALRTETRLKLRADHAAAQDAVQQPLDLPQAFLQQHQFLELQTQCRDKREYLMRPDLGRKLAESSRRLLQEQCTRGGDILLMVGDGLSSEAVQVQVPELFSRLVAAFQQLNWNMARPVMVKYCRVGVMNEIGEWLNPEVVILLIGERPGLATAQSLSAYLAYQPKPGHTDAQRNLISNIHAAGVPISEATTRIVGFAQQLRQSQTSGTSIKEQLPNDSPRLV